jgi:hypothetical protein
MRDFCVFVSIKVMFLLLKIKGIAESFFLVAISVIYMASPFITADNQELAVQGLIKNL